MILPSNVTVKLRMELSKILTSMIPVWTLFGTPVILNLYVGLCPK